MARFSEIRPTKEWIGGRPVGGYEAGRPPGCLSTGVIGRLKGVFTQFFERTFTVPHIPPVQESPSLIACPCCVQKYL